MALAAWDSLTVLDLWRVQLVLSPQTRQPKFRLRELTLISCELSSKFVIEWLLGEVGGTRSARLEKLIVNGYSCKAEGGTSAWNKGLKVLGFGQRVLIYEAQIQYGIKKNRLLFTVRKMSFSVRSQKR